MPLDIMSLLGGGQQQDQQDQDPLAALGLSPVSHKDAMTMSLLQALQAQQQAGLQRTASPIGAIANALVPLVAAPIQARQIETKSVRDILPILAELRRDDPEKAALDKANILSQIQERGKPKNIEDEILTRIRENKPFQDLIEAKRAIEKPTNPTEATIAQQAAMGDPQAQKTWNVLLQGKAAMGGAIAAAGAAARVPFEEHMAQYKSDLEESKKKTLSEKALKDFTEMDQGIRNLDNLLSQMSNPKTAPSRGGAFLTQATGGMVQSPEWGLYADFKNKVAHQQFGSRQTTPELSRLNKVLPDPISYFADPKGFFKRVKQARNIAAEIYAKEVKGTSKYYKVDQELLDNAQAVEDSLPKDPTKTKAEENHPVLDKQVMGQQFNRLKKLYPNATTEELVQHFYAGE